MRFVLPLIGVVVLIVTGVTAAAPEPAQQVRLSVRVQRLEVKVTKLQRRVNVLQNQVDTLRVLVCLQIPSC